MEEININVTKNIEEVEINVEPNVTQVIITELYGGAGVETLSGNLVDNTDPNNPIVNGLSDITAGTNITIDKTDPANPVISADGGGNTPTLQELFEQNAAENNNIAVIEMSNNLGEITFTSSDENIRITTETVEARGLNSSAILNVNNLTINESIAETVYSSESIAKGDGLETKFLNFGIGDGSVTIPDLEGEDEIIATREWVTANAPGGVPTLQEVTEVENRTNTGLVISDGASISFMSSDDDPEPSDVVIDNKSLFFQFDDFSSILIQQGQIDMNGVSGGATQILSDGMIRSFGSGRTTKINFENVPDIGGGRFTIPNLEGEQETAATREWVTANVSGGAVDSVNGETGVVVLDASDVGAEPALGFTPENVANKTTDLTSPNNTKYPTSQAVKNYAQPQMMRYLVSSILTQTNTAQFLSINGGDVTSSTGILSVNPFSADNAKEAISRVVFRTAGTTGALAFYRTSRNILFLKDDFFLETTILNSSLLSGSRFFFGLSSASTANPTNVSPDSIINQVGFCKPASSNNLHVIHNDNTGTATTIDLGSNFSMIDPNGSFYLLLENTPGTGVKYTVVRMNENLNQTHSATGVISTNLPNETLSLFHRLWITNNDVSDVVELFWRGLTYGKLLN